MTDSNDCKTGNRKLTTWGQQHLNLLLATRSIIDVCIAQGTSLEDFLRIVAILKPFYEPDIQDAKAAHLLDEIRDLLSKSKKKIKKPEPSIPDLASSLSRFSEKERLYLLRSLLESLRLSIQRERLCDRVRRQHAGRSS